MAAKDQGKTYYYRAWPLLFYALLCYFLTGTVSGIMNVAPDILGKSFGWDSTTLISSMSIAALLNVAAGFVAGRVSARRSAKPLCFVWGAVYMVGLVVMGIAPTMSVFIVSMVLVSAVSSAWGYNTVPILITNWFPEKKGRVQGFVSTGLLLGSVNPMIYNWGCEHLGIHLATVPFVALGGIALLFLAFGISDRPEERGLEPDTMRRVAGKVYQPAEPLESTGTSGPENLLGAGGSASKAASPRTESVLSQSEMARLLLRNPRFLGCSLVMGVQLIFAGGLMVQLIPRLLDLGFPMDEALLVMLVASLFGCLGSIVFGVLGDKLGADTGVVLTYAAGIAAVLLNVSGCKPLVYISVALIGCVVGTADNWPVSVCAEQFGREQFAASFGVMFPVIQLVGAAGPAFFALIAGASNYTMAYVAGGVLMFVALVAYVYLSKTKNRPENTIAFKG